MRVNDAALDRLIVKTNELGKTFIGASNAMKPLDAQLRALGRRQTEFGRYMTRNFTAPMLLAAGAAAKMGFDFDKSMSRIQTLGGGSAEEVKKLSKEVLALSSSTLTGGPQDLAEALYFIRSSGVDAEHAMEVLKAANMGAMIGMGDTKTVADAVTSAMNAYGASVGNAERVTDIFAATVEKGKAEPAELARSIGYVIPLAAQMGVKLAEVGGFVATLTLQGLSASSAITGLRATLVTFAKGQPQVVKALAAIDLSIDAIQTNIRKRGLASTLNEIRDRVDKFDKSGGKLAANTMKVFNRYGVTGEKAFLKLQRSIGNTGATLLSQLFPNIRALNAFLITTGKHAQDTANNIGAVGNSAGMTRRKFEEIRKQNWAQFAETWSKLRTEFTKIGRDILPFFTALLKVALKVFGVLTFDWAGRFKPPCAAPTHHRPARNRADRVRAADGRVPAHPPGVGLCAAPGGRRGEGVGGEHPRGRVDRRQAAGPREPPRRHTLTAAATVAGVDAATAAYAREAIAVEALSIAQASATEGTVATAVAFTHVMRDPKTGRFMKEAAVDARRRPSVCKVEGAMIGVRGATAAAGVRCAWRSPGLAAAGDRGAVREQHWDAILPPTTPRTSWTTCEPGTHTDRFSNRSYRPGEARAWRRADDEAAGKQSGTRPRSSDHLSISPLAAISTLAYPRQG